MNEYTRIAEKFLKDCDAKMTIIYLGMEINKNWNEKCKRDVYLVNIVTPLGDMQVKFWDSVYDTEKNTQRKLCGQSLKKPTAYDILSCLTTYDVGDIEDFIFDYGYEIKKKGDFTRIQYIYNAVKKEYEDVCRCFTENQIEQLCEII